MDTHTQFCGSIPAVYDQALGPFLFDWSVQVWRSCAHPASAVIALFACHASPENSSGASGSGASSSAEMQWR